MIKQYDEILDLISNNTTSIITRMVAPNSIVLEFGPAYGKLTQYLSEELNCEVYIVEIDEEAGAVASKYAKASFIGDIESYDWIKEFGEIKFDYALFADVLEHLLDPDAVLRETKKVLKYSGAVIVSVPNIAHNSVIIDLMNNKFEYKLAGLLDKTHLRFFTKNSLEELFNNNFYRISQRYAVYKEVGSNEIINSYSSVSYIAPSVWKNRPYGDIYQFVYEAKNSSELVSSDNNYIVSKLNHYFAQMYFDTGCGYDENITIRKYLNMSENNVVLYFDLENVPSEIKAIRFDPLNARCLLEIKSIVALTDLDSRVELTINNTNARNMISRLYCFLDNDPQIYIDINGFTIRKIIIEIEYKLFDSSLVDYNYSLLEKLYNEFYDDDESKEKLIKKLEIDQVSSNESIKEGLNWLQEKESIIEIYNKLLDEKENIINELKKELETLINTVNNVTNIENCENTNKMSIENIDLLEKIEMIKSAINRKNLELINISDILVQEQTQNQEKDNLISDLNIKINEVSILNKELLYDIKMFQNSKTFKVINLLKNIFVKRGK